MPTCLYNNVYNWLSDEKRDRHFPITEEEAKRLLRLLPSICSPRSAQNDREELDQKHPNAFYHPCRKVISILILSLISNQSLCQWLLSQRSLRNCLYISGNNRWTSFVFLFLAIVLFCSDSSDLLKSELTDFYSNPLNCALAESFYGYTKLVLNKLYQIIVKTMLSLFSLRMLLLTLIPCWHSLMI